MPDLAEPPQPRRRGNGLLASYFVALADVDPRLGAHLLDLLRLADVPAYLEPAAPDRARGRSPRDRLYVAGTLREQALAVVAAAADEAGGRVVPATSEDLLAGIDTEAEFAALVADWEGAPVDPPSPAPTDVTDPPEEHYEPPPPPPLPRLSTAAAGGVLLVALGIFVVARAAGLGLDAGLGLPLGVVLILIGFGILVTRMRDGSAGPPDDDDDGAVI